MQQWDRDTSGRLNRISTQLDLASEVSVQTDTMDPIPEEQQSQPGTPMNPNAYRTMRDHIHPPRVSAPSCIIPPADDVAVRPYLVPLLPTYHGMENENPYTHLRDFEEVCTTFKEGMMDMDLLKLKAFPLTLKDKAKIWLNSLRPRTIRNWAELQAEFLKKFFSAHKTNNLKRQIYTFAAHEGEKFYQCWERFLETTSACPHHGFDTWMLVNHFYDGMSPPMKQLVETMCGGNFLSKHPDEAIDFLNYIAETSKAWDEPRPREDVPGEEAEDAHRDDPPAPAPDVQRSPTPISDRSPPSPPHTTSAAAPTDTPGPSYSAHQSPEYTHVSSREMAGVMDAICTLAATQAAQHAAQEQRLTQCYTMLQQIMTHLGLPHDPAQREEPATDTASLDVLAAAAAASHPPPPQQ